jgi:hypothetical protein
MQLEHEQPSPTVDKHPDPGQRSGSCPAGVEKRRGIPRDSKHTGSDNRMRPNYWAIAQPGVYVRLFRPASLAHHLHNDFMQVGAGGI